ncbi:MAG: hypothetical protein ACYCOO_10005, partial [Chitinophagaceae bacterium]
YPSLWPDGFQLSGQPEAKTKLIAIGGIDRDHVRLAFSMGFFGVAAHGTLWENPKESVKRFKQLKKICAALDPVY